MIAFAFQQLIVLAACTLNGYLSIKAVGKLATIEDSQAAMETRLRVIEHNIEDVGFSLKAMAHNMPAIIDGTYGKNTTR